MIETISSLINRELMKLYEIEIEFIKVLLLGIFFGWYLFKILGKEKPSSHLREIIQFKYFDLNKKKKIKLLPYSEKPLRTR
jgi:hypothetical protein